MQLIAGSIQEAGRTGGCHSVRRIRMNGWQSVLKWLAVVSGDDSTIEETESGLGS